MSGGSASYRDPENAAVVVGDRWYRVAAPESAAALIHLRESGVYESLVGQGALLGYELAGLEDEPFVLERYREATGRQLAAGSRVFEVETVDLITYPWEWPDYMLRAAGVLTLDIRDRLLSVGLELKDASAFNVQFRGMKPVFIDLGSVERWRPNPSWNPTRQYVEHFINPLAVGSGPHLTAADAWELSHRKGLRSDVARSIMPGRLRKRPSLWVLQTSTKPVADHAPIETKYALQARQSPDLALKATRSLMRRLRKQTLAVSTADHSTTWREYGDREHYAEGDLERKIAMSIDFIVSGSPNDQVLDIGGNDGLVASGLVEGSSADVIVVDPDGGALDALGRRVLEAPLLEGRITPLCADLLNLTPASGLLDREFLAFTQRIRPSAVLCQAVLHHIVITQGVPMNLAVQALARFGAPVLVEFATEDDPKVELLISQIPNWAGDYSTQSLLDSLDDNFENVSEVGRTSQHRVVVTTGRPRA